jgi:hypothetical protein
MTRQSLVAQDLTRFNIKTIFVDEFVDITRLIRTLENRFRRRTVFISGSADDYGSWGRPATEEFMSNLARARRVAGGFCGIGWLRIARTGKSWQPEKSPRKGRSPSKSKGIAQNAALTDMLTSSGITGFLKLRIATELGRKLITVFCRVVDAKPHTSKRSSCFLRMLTTINTQSPVNRR